MRKTGERTTWVECAYWSDRTAVGQYLKKGQLVYAEGAPEVDAYTNKENQPAATLRMRVMNLQLLGGSKDNQSNTTQGGSAINNNNNNAQLSSTSTVNSNTVSVAEDDLPF